jgi:hypothetical protein
MAGITVPISSAMRTRAVAAIVHLWPDASTRPAVTDYTPRELRHFVRAAHRELVGDNESALVAEGWIKADTSAIESNGASGALAVTRFTSAAGVRVS